MACADIASMEMSLADEAAVDEEGADEEEAELLGYCGCGTCTNVPYGDIGTWAMVVLHGIVRGSWRTSQIDNLTQRRR